LKQILVPPPDPIATGGPEQWAALENRLDMRFPSDYKEFISTYGHGSPSGIFFVLNPFVTNGYNLESHLDTFRQAYREVYSQPYYDDIREGRDSPIPEGLVPWATGNDGGTAFWDAGPGDPDSWTVIETLDNVWQDFPGSMSELLVAAITRTYESIVYGELPRKLPIRYQSFPDS
jgi:hypothetical protein